MSKIIIIIFHGLIIPVMLVSIICGCSKERYTHIRGNYFQDSRLTYKNGMSRKGIDSTLYLPWVISSGNWVMNLDRNNSSQSGYSSILSAMKEPILYNFYTGHDIYRIMYSHSFYLPIVLRIEDYGDSITLNVKQIDKIYKLQYPKNAFAEPPIIFMENIKTGKADRVNLCDDWYHDFVKANIIYNNTIQIDRGRYNQFLEIIEKAGFWDLVPSTGGAQIDGAAILLEAHTRDRYWFAERCYGEDWYLTYLVDFVLETAKLPSEVTNRPIPSPNSN